MACSSCGQPNGVGHLPNCGATDSNPNAALNQMRARLKVSAKDKRAAWYPKYKGKPVPEHKLSEYEVAIVLAKGNTKKVVERKGHFYFKG